MSKYIKMARQAEERRRQERIKYPFSSLHIEPWTLFKDPLYQPFTEQRPARIIPEKPIYQSKRIRFEYSYQQIAQERLLMKRKKKRSLNFPVISHKPIIEAVKQGNQIYIDLNTKKPFIKWNTGKNNPPLSKYSKLNDFLIEMEEEANSKVQNSRKRLQQIKSTLYLIQNKRKKQNSKHYTQKQRVKTQHEDSPVQQKKYSLSRKLTRVTERHHLSQSTSEYTNY